MAEDEADSVVMLKNIRAKKTDTKKPPSNLEDRVALHFADCYAEHFRYIAAWGWWMLWNGIHWKHEDTLAKTVAAVVTLARTDRAIAATEDQWDVDHEIFNLPTERTKQEN
jgi:putative DNA primase/helicase